MDKRLLFFIAALTILLLPTSVWAFSSSSDNYKLEGEFGMFGGAKSSDNYALTDTGGGFAPGYSSGGSYGSGSGFQYVLAEVPQITFSISGNSVSLGTLSGTPVGVSQTISVSTNAAKGYRVTVQQDGNICRTVQPCNSTNDIDPVSGGTVQPNTEAYGLGTSKSGQDILQNTSCGTSFTASAITTSPQTVASYSLPTSGSDSTTLCYSAAISGTTAAGNYSHILTYIATGTF